MQLSNQDIPPPVFYSLNRSISVFFAEPLSMFGYESEDLITNSGEVSEKQFGIVHEPENRYYYLKPVNRLDV